MISEISEIIVRAPSTLHHTCWPMVVYKKKLTSYDAKSQKLVYLLMLAVFYHKLQIVIDVRAVKAD